VHELVEILDDSTGRYRVFELARPRHVRVAVTALVVMLLSTADDPARGQSGRTAGADPGTAASPTELELDALYEQAIEAFAANRFRTSIRLFEQVTPHRPDDIELHYWLGVAHWKREDGEGAIAAYEHAVALDPGSENDWSLYALENLAEVLTRTDQMEDSKAAYEAALARETRAEWVLKIQNQLAELDLALGTFVPDEATVFNDRGEVIGGVGPEGMRTNKNFEIARHTTDPEKAARYYRLAIDTDPTMYQSYFNLGWSLVRQGRYEEAIPWLDRSDEVWKQDTYANPDGIDKGDAHAFLARCHLELGDVERAGEHADRAALADGANFWVRLYTQRVRVAQGEADTALAILTGLALENPEHEETLAAVAEARSALGLTEVAP
jgi:tetratricopeptide (TPR) repeat protein